MTGTAFSIASYEAGSVIFCQGRVADTVMQIDTGRVRLAVTAQDGKEAICGVLEPGAFLGEDALGGRSIRRQTAVAMTATEVVVIAKAEMIGLINKRPELSDRFIVHLIERHLHLEADLADQLLNSSEQRLARALLKLAGCDGRHPCQCTLPHVSQEVIAEMVGTTRSRVNRFMGEFKKLGLIEQDCGVIRVNPSLMRAAYAAAEA